MQTYQQDKWFRQIILQLENTVANNEYVQFY